MKRMNLIELDNEENMKSFFKACLYEELDDYENADSMRNLFINIIYNGFDVNKYLDWILDISDDTKIAITKGVKEKKMRVDLENLLFNTVSNATEDKNIELEDLNFIYDLIKKWKCNEEKSSKYYKAIKEEHNYSYIIIGEDAPWSGAYLLGDIEQDKKGPYYSSLKNAFKDENIYKLSDGLKNQKVLFFDLLTIPLPINSVLRKKWSAEDVFKFYEKPLPVFLLEIAFEHFKLKDKIEDAKIAIMMPTKTSASIYNYFEAIFDENNELYCLKEQLTAKSCWQEINNNYSDILTKGKCFNYYKSNTISGSNTPDIDLLKYALSK